VPSTQKTWTDSVPIDMLLSVVSVLVVVQPTSEIPEIFMNYPIYSDTSANEDNSFRNHIR